MPRAVTAERALQLKSDFLAKNSILAAHTQPLSPLAYYELIFGSLEGRRLYIVENQTYGTATVDELMDMATMRADIYVPPCDFFRDFYNLKTVQRVYALVVDIDNVPPLALEQLLQKARTDRYIEPTLVGNSGAGVHLCYVFSAPLEGYRRRLPALKAMARALGDMYRGFGRVDRNSLIQAYRLPGSLTKLGDTMTGYRAGATYDALQLARLLGVDTVNWGDGKMEKDKKEPSAPPKPMKGKVKVMPRVYNGRKLYDYVTWRVFRDTQISHRYTSMLGIAIVGYKCRVPREEVLQELENLAALWTERNLENPVQLTEVGKALRAYSAEYVRVSSLQLEEYFGWQFERKTRRKGRSQAEHLERARAVKDALVTLDKRKKIEKYLKAHPGASQREVAKMTGLSRNTVARYWPS